MHRSLSGPGRKLVSQADQAMIPRADVPRSRFQGSATLKTSFDAGLIYPIFVDEILPGDHMRYQVRPFVRMNTPVFPMMDNLRVDIHAFFCPIRLVWDNAEEFWGALEPTGYTEEYGSAHIIPQVEYTEVLSMSLFDYLGIPPTTLGPNTDTFNALIPRIYNLCWNEWYRDQNLQQSVQVLTGDADGSVEFPFDIAGDYVLLPRAKAHDIFTSSLPWPQKFPSPVMAFTGGTGLAPVTGIGIQGPPFAGSGPEDVVDSTAEAMADTVPYTRWFRPENPETVYIEGAPISGGFRPNIFADLTDIEGFGLSIATFREAIAVQSLFESFARGGTRYIEMLKAIWNVTAPDFRLQRPEFLGGGSARVQIEAVAYTAESALVTAGVLGGAGTASGSISFSVASSEHGYVLVVASVRSELSYQAGLHPMWKRRSPLDFPWPQLAGIGEEAILQGQLFYSGVPAVDSIVFGYNERYQWHRTFLSQVTGGMRSNAGLDLDRWHLAQDFGAPGIDPAPTLSAEFIVENPPMERVLVAGELALNQEFIADILIDRDATRALPQYGTPDSLRRF